MQKWHENLCHDWPWAELPRLTVDSEIVISASYKHDWSVHSRAFRKTAEASVGSSCLVRFPFPLRNGCLIAAVARLKRSFELSWAQGFGAERSFEHSQKLLGCFYLSWAVCCPEVHVPALSCPLPSNVMVSSLIHASSPLYIHICEISQLSPRLACCSPNGARLPAMTHWPQPMIVVQKKKITAWWEDVFVHFTQNGQDWTRQQWLQIVTITVSDEEENLVSTNKFNDGFYSTSLMICSQSLH